MLLTGSNLDTLFKGFKTSFNKGWEGVTPTYDKVAMTVTSTTGTEQYGWLGQFPKMREWIGDRVIHNLKAHGWAIENRDFENTVSVPRNAVEDDHYGVFEPMFQEMGRNARLHPDETVYDLISRGGSTFCYDGQYFFDQDHKSWDADGNEISFSNLRTGLGPMWFLLDTSKAVKPFVLQMRRNYNLVSKDRDADDNVFFRKEFLYGVDARLNAGYALWQLAYASGEPLTVETYEAARTAMQAVRGEGGRKLGVSPTVLLAPRALEGAARRVVVSAQRVIDEGGTPLVIANEWAGTAELVVSDNL